MIITLRGWLKSKTAKTVLFITIAAVAGIFAAIPSFFKESSGTSSWAFKVNGETLSQGMLLMRAQARQQQAQLIRAKYGDNADYILAAYGLEGEQAGHASEMLIGEALLGQAARKTGLILNDDYLEEHNELVLSELMSILGDSIDPRSGINPRKLRSSLMRYGLPTTFVHDAANGILERHLMIDLISAAAYVPRFELEQQMRNTYAPRTYSLLSFSFAQALAAEKKVGIKDTELEVFYKKETELKGRYWVPEKRSATVYYFTPADYGTVVTEQEIENYYDNYKTSRYIQEPVKVSVRKILVRVEEASLAQAAYEKAQQIKNRLETEKLDFAKIAQEMSDDAVTAKNGGLVAPFARGTYETDFEKAAFMLKKDGDISPIAQTKDGFVILQRVSKKPAVFKSLASVKGEISKALTHSIFSERFMNEASALTSDQHVNKADLEAFVAEKKGHKESLNALERTNENWGKMLFALQEGAMAATLVDNRGAIVVLSGVAKRSLPSLEAIKATVKDDLCEERAAKTIAKDVAKAAEELKKRSAAEVAQALGARLETIRDLTPGKEEVIKSLEKRGVPVQEMLQIEKVGGIAYAVGEQDGFVAKLESILPNETALTDSVKKAELSRSLQAQEESLLAQGLVASLYRNATITTNNQLLSEEMQPESTGPLDEDFSY
jgi:hypothetical protein